MNLFEGITMKSSLFDPPSLPNSPDNNNNMNNTNSKLTNIKTPPSPSKEEREKKRVQVNNYQYDILVILLQL